MFKKFWKKEKRGLSLKKRVLALKELEYENRLKTAELTKIELEMREKRLKKSLEIFNLNQVKVNQSELPKNKFQKSIDYINNNLNKKNDIEK